MKLSLIKILSFSFMICFFVLGQAQNITVYKNYEDLKKDILDIKDDKIYIVNFWATWCGPCVKELPFFEELGQKLDPKETEIILVSIDWETNLKRKVQPFVDKKGLKNKVVLFDDPKANDWIDKIDPSWSGAIPITLFIDKNRKQFYEKEYHNTSELEADLLRFIESK